MLKSVFLMVFWIERVKEKIYLATGMRIALPNDHLKKYLTTYFISVQAIFMRVYSIARPLSFTVDCSKQRQYYSRSKKTLAIHLTFMQEISLFLHKYMCLF